MWLYLSVQPIAGLQRYNYSNYMKRLLIPSLCLALAAATLISCTQTKFPKYTSLVNQGLLPLSTSNAFLGSNLFISEEAQRSRQLYNFLVGRGGPTAIELSENAGQSPRLLMFYPRDKEVYAAELADLETEKGGRFREWVIRGPYSIERKDYKELARLESSFNGEPLFMISGREHRFRYQPVESEEQIRTVIVPVLPTPIPTPTPRPKQKIITAKAPEKPKLEELRGLNSDQQALRMSQGFAERAENGDVIHTVTSESETIQAISKWYTGIEGQAIPISVANKLTPGAPLQLGARIQIPFPSLATDKLMPAGFK